MSKKNIRTVKKAKQPEKTGQNNFKALTAICGIMVSGASIDKSLGYIASITSDILKVKACSVMVYDSKNQELSLKAALGTGLDFKDKISVKSGDSISGRAIKERKTITSVDISKAGTPILPGTAEFSDISSMISSPIMYNNEPIGVINAYGDEKRIFTDDDKITMQAIANQSAVALQIDIYREEVIAAKEALKDRKIIDKAKGILMKHRNMTEDMAYKTMRSKSMDTCKPMKDVAEAIILAHEIRL